MASVFASSVFSTRAASVCDRLFTVRSEDIIAIIERQGLARQHYYVSQVRPNADRSKLFIQLRGWPISKLLIASRDGLELIESVPLVAYYDELGVPIAWSTNLSKQGITFTNGLTLESGHFRLDYSGKYFVHTIRNRIYVGVPGADGQSVGVTNAYGSDIFATTNGIIVVGTKKVVRKDKSEHTPYFWVIATNAAGFFVTSETAVPNGYIKDVDSSGRWLLCQTQSDLFPKLFVYDSLSKTKLCNVSNSEYCFFDASFPIEVLKSNKGTRSTARKDGKQF